VAELGAAFLCADLGITPESRDDHAAYIAQYLDVLKNDKRAIFTAAAYAQRAADYLHNLQPPTDCRRPRDAASFSNINGLTVPDAAGRLRSTVKEAAPRISGERRAAASPCWRHGSIQISSVN
jgi:hypothetical protein